MGAAVGERRNPRGGALTEALDEPLNASGEVSAVVHGHLSRRQSTAFRSASVECPLSTHGRLSAGLRYDVHACDPRYDELGGSIMVGNREPIRRLPRQGNVFVRSAGITICVVGRFDH